jgi:hypothetical protein
VTELQVLGYSVALCGAFYYNYRRLSANAKKPAEPAYERAPLGVEDEGSMQKKSAEIV